MGDLEKAGYTVSDVLAWVNNERKHELNLPPLDHIPRAILNEHGTYTHSCGCPIAVALGSSGSISGQGPIVDGTHYYPDWPTLEQVLCADGVELPVCVRLFISDFDAGLYPELNA